MWKISSQRFSNGNIAVDQLNLAW